MSVPSGMSGERTRSSAVREAQTLWFDYPMSFDSHNTILFIFDTFNGNEV